MPRWIGFLGSWALLVLALGLFWIFIGAAQVYTGWKKDFKK